MPVNLAKHVRRLVAKRDRLTKHIDRRQRELDAVTKQLGTLQGLLSPDDPTPPPTASQSAAVAEGDRL